MDTPSGLKSDGIQETSEYNWNDIYERFFPLVLAKVRTTRGWDALDSHGVAHEIIGVAIQNVKDGCFNGDSSLGTYVYAITRNQISSRVKKLSRQKEVPLNPLIPSSSNPVDLAEKEERRQLMVKAISSLKPQHQDVVYKRYYEGMRVSEVSEAMGIPPKKVSELLHYSLKKLRISLQNEFS